MHDPISDFLTRIRNASAAKLSSVVIPYSKTKEAIAQVLKKEGYVASYSIEGDKVKQLNLVLKYSNGQGVITGLKQISTPGLRRYVSVSKIPKVLGGMGVSILTTPKGVLSGADAKKFNIGGEVICHVW